ncbi:MAG: DUF7933 domain-containing protein, partial [Thermoanaerobaculia bacterium]
TGRLARRFTFVVASALATVPLFSSTVFPPTVDMAFSPAYVPVNGVSVMTITLTNPNDSPLTGASIIDAFPAGLVNAGPFPGTAATTCGSAVLFPGPTNLLLINGTIPANGSCTVTAPVFSANPGLYSNSTGSLFSSGPASLHGGTASLTVFLQVPALSSGLLLALAITLAALGTPFCVRRF